MPKHLMLGSATLLLLATAAASAQTLTTLYSFAGQVDGGFPRSGVILEGHTLYGTTYGRGQFGYGTVFSLDLDTKAMLTVLHQFAGGADGQYPAAPLIDSNGTLFGTTENGGIYNSGTVYRVGTQNGMEAVLSAFGPYPDGTTPAAGLITLGDTLYGTTSSGGDLNGGGTVISVNTQTGREAVLHRFTTPMDGAGPFSNLVAIGGMLYGTTYYGGTGAGGGTVFKTDPTTGNTTIVHSFAGGRDGRNPAAGLVAVGSKLYGTTYYGGRADGGTVFEFDVKTSRERIIYRFKGRKDGFNPDTNLAYANGILYGTTVVGGTRRDGTLYQVDIKTRVHTVLHSFTSAADGGTPAGGVIASDGHIYGTTMVGGPNRYGTVFVYKP